jgi:hypothetical protein
LGRDYYEHGGAPERGHRNGQREGAPALELEDLPLSGVNLAAIDNEAVIVRRLSNLDVMLEPPARQIVVGENLDEFDGSLVTALGIRPFPHLSNRGGFPEIKLLGSFLEQHYIRFRQFEGRAFEGIYLRFRAHGGQSKNYQDDRKEHSLTHVIFSICQSLWLSA